MKPTVVTETLILLGFTLKTKMEPKQQQPQQQQN